MVKKDNELELAKLEVKREIAKDVFVEVKNVLSNRKAQFVLGCTGAALSFSLLCICFYNFNTTQNILEN